MLFVQNKIIQSRDLQFITTVDMPDTTDNPQIIAAFKQLSSQKPKIYPLTVRSKAPSLNWFRSGGAEYPKTTAYGGVFFDGNSRPRENWD